MTRRTRISRFRIRPRPEPAAPEPTAADALEPDAPGSDLPPPTGTPASADPQDAATPNPPEAVAPGDTDPIPPARLRLALRLAQRHGMAARDGHEALRLLHAHGLAPELTGGAPPLPSARPPAPAQLPQRWTPPPAPALGLPEDDAAGAEIRAIQRDIARRRRRRLAGLAARLVLLVLLPTLLVGWYQFTRATPLYTAHAEFVIQKAEAPAAPAGLGGLFSGTALATSQDAVAVQSFLQSREALGRLDADHDFRAHFSAPWIDPLLRLSPEASFEAAHRLYGRMVQVGYDPSEGLVRLEVRAADPETSLRFAEALIGYAEEQVDQLTRRLREDQMAGARDSVGAAEARMRDAQARVVDLQERYSMLSSDVELGLLTPQITALQTRLLDDRLALQQMLANERPNPARVEPLRRRIADLEAEIATLRARLTDSGSEGGSIARISAELAMAQADVQTRQMMLSQALQQLEAARVEANRQVRYLSLGVRPVAADEPSHPRAAENTLLALLIFAGAYLVLSMTAAILREQVSS